MRKFALAAALAALMVPAAAGDLIVRKGGDYVRLMEAPCTSELVLARLDPSVASEYRGAAVQLGGQPYTACWRVVGNVAHLVYDDGDQGVIPVGELRPVMEI